MAIWHRKDHHVPKFGANLTSVASGNCGNLVSEGQGHLWFGSGTEVHFRDLIAVGVTPGLSLVQPRVDVGALGLILFLFWPLRAGEAEGRPRPHAKEARWPRHRTQEGKGLRGSWRYIQHSVISCGMPAHGHPICGVYPPNLILRLQIPGQSSLYLCMNRA